VLSVIVHEAPPQMTLMKEYAPPGTAADAEGAARNVLSDSARPAE
jgi:hypothetical protein